MSTEERLDRLGRVAERLSAMTWISLPRGGWPAISVKRATNSANVWRGAVLPPHRS